MIEHYEDSDIEMFKDHIIQVIEDYDYETGRGEYIWTQPKSMFYRMYIIFRPGVIIIYGDLSSWVLRPGGRSLPWLRGAIKSPGYMFEKVTDHKEAYDKEATRESALDYIYDYKEAFDPEYHGKLDGINLVEWDADVRKEMEFVDWSDPNSAYDFFNDTLELDDAYEYVKHTWKAEGFKWPWLGLKTFLDELDKENNKDKDKEKEPGNIEGVA